ncbi:hypothetical protein FHS12_000362 [Nocardioides albus]|uniref:Uncharacterized protein n=1 Tax=Nocardioides albus TaxID=1841 RepID=A0A7W5A0V1_9ACTN|nr:hypothetical protein [Nocardioides albus]
MCGPHDCPDDPDPVSDPTADHDPEPDDQSAAGFEPL